jgi:hypothetical protein
VVESHAPKDSAHWVNAGFIPIGAVV